MEKSQAEMRQPHEQALANPLYAAEGMLDVFQEEMAMSMPHREKPPEVIYVEPEVIPAKQINQLKAQILHLENEMAKLRKRKDELAPY